MTTKKHKLTATMIDAFFEPGDYWDATVPGFGVRVFATRHKSFILYYRPPGKPAPVRRTIGMVGKIDIATARKTALEWLGQILSGTDPHAAIETKVREAGEAQANRFEVMCEKYLASRSLEKVKKRNEITRMLRREFMKPWHGIPVQDIKTKHVSQLIVAKVEEGSAGQARFMLSQIKRFFSWAVNLGLIDYSPAHLIHSSKAIGEMNSRDRVLNDDELARVWHAAGELGYPYGTIWQMLTLTGLRLNEVVRASWSEFDMKKLVWIIPANRMKTGMPHEVPITPMLRELLDKLPRGTEGDHLFSFTGGATPTLLGNDIKHKFDALCGVTGWRNHDLRRTMRTRLSPKATGIPRDITERMLAHVPQGMQGVYDQYEYLDEKREGFVAWHQVLRAVVTTQRAARLKLKLV